jgi:hypothetical protein
VEFGKFIFHRIHQFDGLGDEPNTYRVTFAFESGSPMTLFEGGERMEADRIFDQSIDVFKRLE